MALIDGLVDVDDRRIVRFDLPVCVGVESIKLYRGDSSV